MILGGLIERLIFQDGVQQRFGLPAKNPRILSRDTGVILFIKVTKVCSLDI